MHEEIYTLIVTSVVVVLGIYLGLYLALAKLKTYLLNLSFKVFKLEMEIDKIQKRNAIKESK